MKSEDPSAKAIHQQKVGIDNSRDLRDDNDNPRDDYGNLRDNDDDLRDHDPPLLFL
eukprot:jgi/Psemu1/30797/gm1.30797_g